jgi:hypothetical protein
VQPASTPPAEGGVHDGIFGLISSVSAFVGLLVTSGTLM